MKIYNTKTRTKEDFIPLEEGKLKLYACGPTVYNYFHIGNARAFIFFDVVRRYFEYLGYEVSYVQNITDIDDKIIEQAISENKDFSEIASYYADAFLEDSRRLGIQPPTVQPRATEVMQEIIALIKELEDKGFAYEVKGNVYFDTTALDSYGSLSGKKIEDQLAGARVVENTEKKHPADFTLWKASKPGEPVWQSPWGLGRPGWHTECVVMSQQHLGRSFDIHGGGIDLVFPHHENENAQAMALTGEPLARYWMHNGFLNVDGDKMSKSLKNFFTARDILKEYPAEAIRFFFLSKHYRSPIDFSKELMEESHKAVQNLHAAVEMMGDTSAVDYSKHPEIQAIVAKYREGMEDDFNSAKAIASLFELASIVRNNKNELPLRQAAASALRTLGSVLGFFQEELAAPKAELPDISSKLIEMILRYRSEARANKDWALSDRIRDELKELGIEIKDSPEGTKWSINK